MRAYYVEISECRILMRLPIVFSLVSCKFVAREAAKDRHANGVSSCLPANSASLPAEKNLAQAAAQAASSLFALRVGAETKWQQQGASSSNAFPPLSLHSVSCEFRRSG